MERSVILFDLDGTLTDSGEGITKCVKLALDHFGIPVESLDSLRYFVGPPLRDSFLKAGIKEENIEEAIAVYRSRYTTVGLFENVPYPYDIHELRVPEGYAFDKTQDFTAPANGGEMEFILTKE